MDGNGDLEFRLADPRGDREALGLLLAEMLAHYNPDRVRPPEAAGARAVDMLERWPGCEILIARREGRPLGLAAFAVVFPAEGVESQIVMKDLFVLREARSRGRRRSASKGLGAAGG